MPSEPSIKRTLAFVDGQNLYHSIRVKLPGGLLPFWGVTYPFHQFHQRLSTMIGGPPHLCPVPPQVRAKRQRDEGGGILAIGAPRMGEWPSWAPGMWNVRRDNPYDRGRQGHWGSDAPFSHRGDGGLAGQGFGGGGEAKVNVGNNEFTEILRSQIGTSSFGGPDA